MFSKRALKLIVFSLLFCHFIPVVYAQDWSSYRHDLANSGISSSDAPDGELLWTFDSESIISTTPVVVGNKLCFGSWDGVMHCLDSNSGKELWTYATNNIITGNPSIYNNKLYFSARDNNIYCLDVDSGDFLWSYYVEDWHTNYELFTSPVGYQGKIYCSLSSNFLVCLDANTGKLVWTSESVSDFKLSSFMGVPVIYDDSLYIGTGSGNSENPGTMFCIDLDTHEVDWSYSVYATEDRYKTVSGATVSDGCLYFYGGEHLLKIDLNTLEVSWGIPISYGTSFVVYNGKIYRGISNYGIGVIDISTEQWAGGYEIEKTVSSPVMADGMLYFGDNEKTFYCIGSESRELQWSAELDDRAHSAIIANERVYVGSNGGTMYCFGSGASPFRKTSSISLQTPEIELIEDMNFNLNGSISPHVHQESDTRSHRILYTITKPDGTTRSERNYDRRHDSSFSLRLYNLEPGTYQVIARWEGNTEYSGAESEPISFFVEPLNKEPTQADLDVGGVLFTIIDQDKNPISGAKISSQKTPSNQSPISDTTDSSGKLSLPVILVGDYRFEISKSGYQTITREVEVNKNVAIGVKISMSQSGSSSTTSSSQTSRTSDQTSTESSQNISGYPVFSILIGVFLVYMLRKR